MKRKIIILVAITFMISNLSAARSSRRIVISDDGMAYKALFNEKRGKELSVMNINTKSISSAYKVKFKENEMCQINYSSLDPMGKYIALGTACSKSDKDYCENPGVAYYKITVVERETFKEVAELDQGNSFSFSPSGDAIVFEQDYPGSDEGCKPPPGFMVGIWIYDFNTKKLAGIDTKGVGANHLVWSEHDNNIYVSNNFEIFRYDPVARKGEIVKLKGYNFSPDGEYVIESPAAESPNIYRTSDNHPMTDWRNKIRQEYGSYIFRAWVIEGNGIIFSVNKPYHWNNIVFNLTTGEVIQEFRGHVLGGDHAGTKVLIHPLEELEDGRVGINRDALEVIEIESEK